MDPLNHPGQRRLARTGAAHDSDDLPLIYGQIDVIQRIHCSAGIAKRRALEIQPPMNWRLAPSEGGISFRRMVHHSSEHVHGKHRFLILIDEPHDLQKGSADAPGKHVERDQRSERDFIVKHQNGADAQNRNLHALLQKLGDASAQDTELLDAARLANRGDHLLVPHLLLRLFQAQRFDGADPVNRLDGMRLAGALRAVQLTQARLINREHSRDHQRDGHSERQNHHRQFHAVGAKEPNQERQRDGIHAKLEQAPRQKLADLGRLLEIPEYNARRHSLEKRHRQREQLLEHLRGKSRIDAVGRHQSQI